MSQALQGATFHLEHIRPVSQGGLTQLDNLAWACPACNLCKSNRTRLPDPDTSDLVPLFNPRRDAWADHFAWEEHRLVGRTAMARALIFAFDLNDAKRLRIRQAEELFGLHPP